MHPNARNLFDKMLATDDETTNHFIIENIIFEGGAGVVDFDLDESQSQDGRGPLMVGHEGMTDTFDQGYGGMADPFMQGQDGMGNTFLQDQNSWRTTA